MKLPENNARLIYKYRNVTEFFDSAVNDGASASNVLNLIIGTIYATLQTEEDKENFEIKTTAKQLADLVKLIDEKKIRANKAKEVLAQMLESGKDDVVPDVMCIYSTMTSDGKINLYKFPKCKFASQGENVQTTDENGVTFNSLALQANYKALINTGVDKYCVKGLDPVTDKASIDAWFATASGVIVAEV